jgi:hypothetical protein
MQPLSLKKNLTLILKRRIISAMKTIVLHSRLNKQLPCVAAWNSTRPSFEGSGYAIEDTKGFGKKM